MSYGLVIKDSTGNITLDISHRVFRYVAMFTIQPTLLNNANGYSLSIPGITNDGTWAVFPSGCNVRWSFGVDSIFISYARNLTTTGDFDAGTIIIGRY